MRGVRFGRRTLFIEHGSGQRSNHHVGLRFPFKILQANVFILCDKKLRLTKNRYKRPCLVGTIPIRKTAAPSKVAALRQ